MSMHFERRRSEIQGLIFLALAVLSLLSLISYTPADLPFLHYPVNIPLKNMISTTGASIGFFLFLLFGKAAFVVPIIFLFWGITKIRDGDDQPSGFSIAGILFLLFFTSAIFALNVSDDVYTAFNRAGYFGYHFSRFLISYFGIVGALIIDIVLVLLAVILTTGISIVTISRILIKPFLYSGRVVRWVKERWSAIRLEKKRGAPKIRGRERTQREQDEGRRINRAENRRTVVEEVEDEEEDSAEEDEEWVEEEETEDEIEEEDVEDEEEAAEEEEESDITAPGQQNEIGVSFTLPTSELLDKPPKDSKKFVNNVEEQSDILEQTLRDFNISAKVVNVEVGPVITRYELEPSPGVKIQRIVNLQDDIALNLHASSVRIIAPIPGKGAVGVEVPNSHRESVYLRALVESDEFKSAESPLTLALGKDTSGQPVFADLREMPHLLIAGTTGSGKTVCVNAIITSLLFKCTPRELRFIMVDPKMVELIQYNKLPHMLCPVITEAKRVSGSINWLIAEMERRYQTLAEEGVRNIIAYNKKNPENIMPYIVLVIDELADLMSVAQDEIENGITRLAQLSRAVGIHLLLATQRPSVDVITGVIKANFPARISFKVASKVDSRTVLDMLGAERLLGKGDMLFLKPGAPKPIRIQGCFVLDSEIERVVSFLSKQAEPQFDESVMQEKSALSYEKQSDELFDKAVETVLTTGQASVSLLQRRMRLGYARAARLIDIMEEKGIIGPYRGSKPREILVDRDDWLRNREWSPDEN